MFFRECSLAADRRFGPLVGCEELDFTLAFEQSILVIGVSVLFLVSLPLRLNKLLSQEEKSFATRVYTTKTALAAIDVALQIASVIFWIDHPLTDVSIPAACLSIATAFGLLALVIVEHTRTVRPSSLGTIYLLCTILSSAVQIRTFRIRLDAPVILRLLLASTADKVLILGLEQWPKTRILKLAREYSPEETSGIIARTVFTWLLPLLQKGYRTILSKEDLFPLEENLTTEKLRQDMIERWELHKTKQQYALVRAVFSLVLWPYIQGLPARAAIIVANYSTTFVMAAAIHYLDTPSHERNPNHAYGLVAATALTYYGAAVAYIVFSHRLNRIKVMIRGGLASLIYRNSMATKTGDDELAALTLMSEDIDNIIGYIEPIFDIPASAAEASVGIWLLWRQLGPVSFAPILITGGCTYLQKIVGNALNKRRAIWTKAIQKRVGLTTNLLRSMKSVKMSGLVGTSARLVQAERVRELQLGNSFRWFIVWMNAFARIPLDFSILVIFAIYAIQAKLQGRPPLSTAQAFASLALIRFVSSPSAMLLYSLPLAISSASTFKRIEDFLLKDQFEDHRPLLEGETPLVDIGSAIELRDVVLDIKTDSEPTPVNLTVPKGSITMLSGPVGCGKSTILKAILGEVHPKSGRISISTPYIGYCSQSPWLQNTTLMKNVIGTMTLDEVWYQRVIDDCNLRPDIAQMPDGDETLLGSKGVSVSGGQKHRIALARALYSRCAILILDDIFSSLDRKTQSIIATKLFSSNGHIKTYRKTVVFTTHSAAMVKFSEDIMVWESAGKLAFAGRTEDWFKERKDHKEIDLPEEEPVEYRKNDRKGDKPEAEESEDENDRIRRQVGDATLWTYYFRTVGATNLAIVVALQLISISGQNFPQIWLKFTTGSYMPPVEIFVGAFTAATIITWNTAWADIAQVLINIGPKSAKRLHEVLVTTTFNAPMSFFESTDTSVLVTRFSKDMSLAEMGLPISIWQLLSGVANCLADLALISVGSSYMVITTPFIVFILFWLQKFYLRTSRQMRLLDLEAKTPLYRHFTETLEGLATIRAFAWQTPFELEATRAIEESQKPYYLLYCVQLWLNIALDLVSATLAVILVALALCVPTSSDPGLIGIGMTTAMMLTGTLQRVISAWARAETSLGSLARTRTFEEETPNENLEEKIEPDSNWPQGRVQALSLSVTYKKGTMALKKADFEVEKGQKIGICGRTGSGKSTFMSVLLRLIDPTDGQVIVDSIDLSSLSRNAVRERLVCLPQDPLLLPGTFEFNLNPETKIDDRAQIQHVLEQVQMWKTVEGKGGLEADLQLDELSHGEQQLFALARAILKKQTLPGPCILVLDEATSNLDSATEAIVQKVIQEEFKDSTVIAVAHRLDTLRDYDKIVVLDKGEVSKVGPAKEMIADMNLE